jgi:hypothetical protein
MLCWGEWQGGRGVEQFGLRFCVLAEFLPFHAGLFAPPASLG